MNAIKRLAVVIVALFSLSVLAGCAASASTDSGDSGISVDKNLLSVDVTLPASFVGGTDDDGNEITPEQYIENMRSEEGILGAKLNSDGSATITMAKSKYNEMLDQLKSAIDEMINTYVTDDSFASIKEITATDKYDTFTIKVDREEFASSVDGIASIGFGIGGMYYQYYLGESDPKVTVDFVDVDTGDLIREVVYPDTDASDDMQSNIEGALTAK